MTQEVRIRYSDFRRETRAKKVTISFSRLTRLHGEMKDAKQQRRVRVTPRHAWHIMAPYLAERASEQARAVVPLGLYLALFQLLILHQQVANPWGVMAGLAATLVGLMVFLEGLRLGLMPLGEAIGHDLPRHRTLPVVLTVAFILGVGVTLAEPAIGALKAAGALVERGRAPYLRAILDEWSWALVLAVGMGVGIAAVVGMLMFIRAWSLKGPVYVCVAASLALTVFCSMDPLLAPVVGLAWDCGGITTGPVTVPLVLALGIGTAASAGKGENSMAGFGIVTLASLLPVCTVLLLGMALRLGYSPEELAAAATAAGTAPASWLDTSPAAEVVGAVRAIVPLVIFMLLVGRLANARIEDRGVLALGITFALVGMALFGLGLTYGLSELGTQAGKAVPGAFTFVPHVTGSPIYDRALGVVVAVAFAGMLGFGATLAEPALNALGSTVETLSNGAFRKSVLVMAVSVGVAAGLALGIAKLVFDLPLLWFLLPGYGVAVVMTWLSDETFVNVAWDSAGVTTGPVTVPLVLAMGLGFGGAVGSTDGFGVLALASLGPILTVLGVGLAIRLRQLVAVPAAHPPMADRPEEVVAP